MFCCGSLRFSNFCPECGTKLRGQPLRELLDYLEGHLKRQKDRVQICRQHKPGRDQPERLGKWERRLAALERGEQKWQRRVDCVREALTEKEQKHYQE